MSAGFDVSGRHVLVAGAGRSGRACAKVLGELGAHVRLADERPGDVDGQPVLRLERPPPETDLVITSPGWRPDSPLLLAAAAAGLTIWGEVELAWRLRPDDQRWLAITGTNGKTTTTGMLAEILGAAGRHAAAVGNIGTPVVEVVRAEPAFEVLAVELSSFQLHWSSTIVPSASAIVNIAADHLDWHGSHFAYAAAKARVFTAANMGLYDADDNGARAVGQAHAARGGHAVPVTLQAPAPGMLGVRAGWLVDEAFGGGDLLAVRELAVRGPHNVTNALLASGLALADGCPPNAVRRGLAAYRPGAHRMSHVARVNGVDFVDDSKGTNPHATAAALRSYAKIVWIAGGLAKGASYQELIAAHADRLAAAVLIGDCAPQIAEAIGRHADQIPVIMAATLDDAVGEAARLARPGDTVLLSPAAASMDMFTDYHQRGEVFAAAVRALPGVSDGALAQEVT